MNRNIYDRQGNPIDERKWGELHEDEDYRRVGLDSINGMTVSTVWLGLDHSFAGEGPIQIFETMVFGGPLDNEMWRYETEDEALAGHKAALELVRELELR